MIGFLALKGTVNAFLVIISLAMVFFCLILYSYMKQLLEKMDKLELGLKEVLEQKVLSKKDDDTISLTNISEDCDKKVESELEIKKSDMMKKQENVQIQQEKIKKNYSFVGNDMQDRKSSSYYGGYESANVSMETNVEMSKISFDLSEFVKKDDRVVPGRGEKVRQSDYLKEVSNQMVQELKPQTIELTEYEKDQEEHAVISYQELLSLKDKFDVKEEDDIRFVDDLKKFRNTL